MKLQLAALSLVLPLLASSLTVEAKVRCNIRDCITVGGMEVTLRAYDAVREGSKLNILKIRRKVADAGAVVILDNIYYKDGMQVHDETTRKTGRDAKKVKLVNWSMPFEGGAWIGVEGECDPYYSACDSNITGGSAPGTRWVGFDGQWDGVCARATVTLNGETKQLFSHAGSIPAFVHCENR